MLWPSLVLSRLLPSADAYIRLAQGLCYPRDPFPPSLHLLSPFFFCPVCHHLSLIQRGVKQKRTGTAFFLSLLRKKPISPDLYMPGRWRGPWGGLCPGWCGTGGSLPGYAGWVWTEGSKRDAVLKTAFLNPIQAGLGCVSCHTTNGRQRVAFTSAISGAAAGSGFPWFYTEMIHPLNFPWAIADHFISGRDIAPSQHQVLPLGLSSILCSSLKVQQAWGPPKNTAAKSHSHP